MSIDTTKAMNYSWMSQASYLDLTAVIPGSATSLQGYLRLKALNEDKIFAENQAKIFTDSTTGYSFINQLANTANGTSVTVFKSSADGSYTIAVRGTEPYQQSGMDLLQDALGVVGAGKAKVQLIEAFRYYKQLTTVAGQAVTYSQTEVNMLSAVLLSGTTLTGGLQNLQGAISAFTLLTANDTGLGKLIPDGATINFTGHSLGGHVAYLLADLVSLSTAISLAKGKTPLSTAMAPAQSNSAPSSSPAPPTWPKSPSPVWDQASGKTPTTPTSSTGSRMARWKTAPWKSSRNKAISWKPWPSLNTSRTATSALRSKTKRNSPCCRKVPTDPSPRTTPTSPCRPSRSASPRGWAKASKSSSTPPPKPATPSPWPSPR
jgi:hypothetical protein